MRAAVAAVPVFTAIVGHAGNIIIHTFAAAAAVTATAAGRGRNSACMGTATFGTAAAMESLVCRLKPIMYGADMVVICKGGVDTEMYFVVAGAVDIKLELQLPVCDSTGLLAA